MQKTQQAQVPSLDQEELRVEQQPLQCPHLENSMARRAWAATQSRGGKVLDMTEHTRTHETCNAKSEL